MEYTKVKSILEYFYKELEKQAEKDGVLIDSPEYQKAKLEVKRRVLLKLKIDLNEFEDIENAQTEKVVKLSKQEKKELVKEVVKEEVMPKDEIKKLIEEYKPVPQIINKIVKEKIIEKPQIIKTTEIIKEIDNTQIEELRKDLFEIQSTNAFYQEQIDKLRSYATDLIPQNFKEQWQLLTSGKLADQLHKHDIRQRRGYGGVDAQTVLQLISKNVSDYIPYTGFTFTIVSAIQWNGTKLQVKTIAVTNGVVGAESGWTDVATV